MKKLMTMVIATTLMAGSTFAGTLYWGSLTAGGDLSPFVDNTASPFSGTAYVFLLSGVNQVSWTGSAWNLNGATLLASSTGTLEATPGTWGPAAGSAVIDANISASLYYQAVLVTATGQAALGDVTGGFWASTGLSNVSNYTGPIFGNDATGALNWQQGDLKPGSLPNGWSPVPEPTSFALLAIGAAAIGLRRRIRK